MRPVGTDAEPLQLLALDVDPMLGIGAALAGNSRTGTSSLLSFFLRYCSSTFHSMGRPWQSQPGVGRVLAEQALRSHHHVLDRVVECVADVDVAVGVGRAVVEDEFLAAFAALNLLVQPLRFPRPGSPAPWRNSAFIGKSVRGRKTVER